MSEPLFESTAPKYPVLFWWDDSAPRSGRNFPYRRFVGAG
jgi:hypothetical protein